MAADEVAGAGVLGGRHGSGPLGDRAEGFSLSRSPVGPERSATGALDDDGLAVELARVEDRDDRVDEQQIALRQPLKAIDLIPYKHQVGGHTTIWRFSRRAVCKQLNNRENEFYETVEQHHRDLLAFMPR